MPDEIATLDDWHASAGLDGFTPPEAVIAAYWPQGEPRFDPAPVAAPGAATPVLVVNNGRWLALCPTLGCGGAQLASKTDPRFFCTECLNAKAGGAWLGITWPDETTTYTIETILGARPDDATQNWKPGETIAALVAENESHGVTIEAA